MKTVYETNGTCSKAILLDIDDVTGVINSVQFVGGCSGNTQGVAALVQGQKATDVISRLEGIKCGARPTSCPDQLAKAIHQAMQ